MQPGDAGGSGGAEAAAAAVAAEGGVYVGPSGDAGARGKSMGVVLCVDVWMGGGAGGRGTGVECGDARVWNWHKWGSRRRSCVGILLVPVLPEAKFMEPLCRMQSYYGCPSAHGVHAQPFMPVLHSSPSCLSFGPVLHACPSVQGPVSGFAYKLRRCCSGYGEGGPFSRGVGVQRDTQESAAHRLRQLTHQLEVCVYVCVLCGAQLGWRRGRSADVLPVCIYVVCACGVCVCVCTMRSSSHVRLG